MLGSNAFAVHVWLDQVGWVRPECWGPAKLQKWEHTRRRGSASYRWPQSQRNVGEHEGINSLLYCGVFYIRMGLTGNFHDVFAYMLHRSSKAEKENDERFHSTV